MKLFLLLFACLLIISLFKPNNNLHNFDSQSTLPLRGLLALFIVFHHLSLRYDFSGYLFGIPLSPIIYFTSMGGPVVAVFFLLTGFGLARSLQCKGISYLQGYATKRFGKILPEFIILTLIMAYYKISMNSFDVLLEHIKSGVPPLMFSWFMYIIIYVYIAFYVSARISKGNVRKTGYLFTILIIINIVSIHKIGWGYYWYNATISVVIGFFAAIYEKRITKLINNPIIIGCLAAIALGTFILLSSSHKYSFIGINLIALMTYVCMRLYEFPKFRFLIFLGEISLNIYLIHGIFISCFQEFETNKYIILISVLITSCISAYFIKMVRSYIENRFKSYSINKYAIKNKIV